MNRRIMLSLLVAMVVVITTSDLQAGLFRRNRCRAPARVTCIKQTCTVKHTPKTVNQFPLGNNAGRWYPYGYK